jgi:hypothetical protein
MNIRNLAVPNPIHPVDLGTVVLRVTVSPVAIKEDIGSRIWRLAFYLLGRDRSRYQRNP